MVNKNLATAITQDFLKDHVIGKPSQKYLDGIRCSDQEGAVSIELNLSSSAENLGLPQTYAHHTGEYSVHIIIGEIKPLKRHCSRFLLR